MHDEALAVNSTKHHAIANSSRLVEFMISIPGCCLHGFRLITELDLRCAGKLNIIIIAKILESYKSSAFLVYYYASHGGNILK